ncbi:hypothetical protein BOVAC1_4559 [Bacteroides ovatus]|nr:hypothetical protein BOVAC1_4559 [Bacteroides ovatus]
MFLSPVSSFRVSVLLGIYRLVGYGRIPKNRLVQKLKKGDRDI